VDITKFENIEFPQEKGAFKKSNKKNIDSSLTNKKSKNLNIYHFLRDFNKVGDVEITDRQKAILYELESMGSKKKPSHGYLAHINNVSDSTIKRELKLLQELTVIRWDRYTNAANWYYLNEKLIEKESKRSLIEWQSRNQSELDDEEFAGRYPEWKIDRSIEGLT
jgi:hypothetical protein